MKILPPFIVGSSIVSTFITLTYIGMYFKNANRPQDVPYEALSILIPIMFGIFNVINVYLQNRFKSPYIAFIVGSLLGIVFSVVGRFSMDLPIKLFNFNELNQSNVHGIAFLLYGLIFSIVVQFFNKSMNLVQ